jgi:ABC-type nitrate/sulfonate/bicarbonate transport system substrate-binding protein
VLRFCKQWRKEHAMDGRRFLLPFGIYFALVIALIPSADAQDKQQLKLVFPSSPSTYALPYFVAKDLGWLDQANLSVEEIWMNGDSTALRPVLSGQADVVMTGSNSLYSAVDKGAKIKSIGSWQPVVDYQFISSKKITGFADLKGKKLASATGMLDQIAKLMLKKHDVAPDDLSYTFLAGGGHKGRLEAVEQAQVDATLVGILFATEGKRAGMVNVLASVNDEIPGLAYGYLVARTEDLADPKKHQAFETLVELSVIKGSRFVMDQPDKAAEVLHNRVPSLDTDFIKEVIVNLNKAKVWGTDGGLNQQATEFSVGLSLQDKSISRKLSTDELLDRSFIEEAIKKVGAQ